MENIAEETSEVTDSTGSENDMPESLSAEFDNFMGESPEDQTSEEGTTDAQDEPDQELSESDEGTQPETENETKQGGLNWEEVPEQYGKSYKALQAEFSKLTQEKADWSKREPQFDQETQAKLTLFDRLNQAYLSDPKFANYLNSYLGEGQQEQQEQSNPLSDLDDSDPVVPLVQSLQKEVQELRNFKETYQSEQTRNQYNNVLDTSINSLKTNYKETFGKDMPAEFESKAYEFVKQYGVADPNVLANNLFKDELINFERQKIINDRKAKANIKKAPTVNANNSEPVDDVVNLDQALEMAYSEVFGN